MKTKIIFFNKFLKIVFIFALTRKFFKHCPKNKMNLHTKKTKFVTHSWSDALEYGWFLSQIYVHFVQYINTSLIFYIMRFMWLFRLLLGPSSSNIQSYNISTLLRERHRELYRLLYGNLKKSSLPI